VKSFTEILVKSSTRAEKGHSWQLDNFVLIYTRTTQQSHQLYLRTSRVFTTEPLTHDGWPALMMQYAREPRTRHRTASVLGVANTCAKYWRFVFGVIGPQWARASSFTRFLDHTQRRTTLGRTPLNEWSARRRDLYLTTLDNHNKLPCPRWESNSQSQQANGRRTTS